METVVVSAADVSLFHVAAEVFGDPLQWWRIGQLNGLSDPDLGWLPGPVELRVPAVSDPNGTGLPVLVS